MSEYLKDRAGRLRAEEAACTAIDSFCAAHAAEFRLLIQTYANLVAEEKLAALRENFWASLPNA